MTINLLKVAALPMGGGYLASLPAEKNEAKKPRAAFMDRPAMKYEDWLKAPEYKAIENLDPIDWSKYLAACQEAA